MHKIRCSALGLLALFALLLTLQTSPAHAKSPAPKVVAAVFYADWCPLCKQMGPSVMKTMQGYAGDKSVKFVKFDLTNDATKAQSAKLAARNKLTPIWKANQKTGMVLLVNGKTHKVLDTIVVTDSEADMKRKIEAAKSG